MALNLSRNTKVFVSSVNGCGTTTGGILSVYISVVGSGYNVGDVVTLTAGGGAGAEAKCIVTGANASGHVSSVAIPNNFRGKDHVTYASNNTNGTLTEASVVNYAGANNGSAAGLALRIREVSALVTTDGKRIATGKFVGNTTACNTFRIGVLDGYSFSQGSDSTDVTISEAGAAPARGQKRFNDSLPPAEWSFGTYVRPFIHGAASFRAAGTYDMCENILWNAMAGVALSDATGAAVATGSSQVTGALVDFLESDVHELLKINLFFALENTTYRLNDAQINQCEIDFSIDGIASITWSGNATTIDQVTAIMEDPSKAMSATTSDAAPSGEVSDKFVEGYNFADTTGPSDADYLRNKLSSVFLNVATEQGGGADSEGLAAKLYAINITGGSLTIANNVTYVTPETIGVVDKSIGSFTGARTVSGSLNMYLDSKDNGSNELLTDLAGATDLVTNVFDMRLFMGLTGTVTLDGTAGEPQEADDFFKVAGQASTIQAGVEFNMPKCHLTVPTIEVADLISTSVEFAAHGSNLLTGDEMKIKYIGVTTHSQTDTYAASSSRAID
jgi:hypothetical protein